MASHLTGRMSYGAIPQIFFNPSVGTPTNAIRASRVLMYAVSAQVLGVNRDRVIAEGGPR